MVDAPHITLIGPWPPPTGGVAAHVQQLFGHLTKRGYPTTVIGHGRFTTAPTIRRSFFQGSRRVFLDVSSGTSWKGLVHGHGTLTAHPTERELRAFLLAIRARRAKWIESLHDGTLLERYLGWPAPARVALRSALCGASHIVAANGSLRDFAIELGVDPEQVTVIGPLLPRDPDAGAGAELPLAGFVRGHTPLMVVVGAMTPNYDHLTAARMLVALRADHGRAGLVAVSSGFARDSAYESEILEAIGGCRDDVVFLEDIASEELRELMRVADVVIRGPVRESFGLSRVEAIMEGTPVVATATGEQRYIIPYLYGDADDLRRAVEIALGPGGDSGLEVARDHYSDLAESNLRDILAIYTQVAAR